MNLHEDSEMFNDLATLTSEWRNIPVTSIKRDYLIVMILEQLSDSKYVDKCVFKGGTSLSKCYPGTINRFSEDIDLTYLNKTDESKKNIERSIKDIEKKLSSGLCMEKVESERSQQAKSSYVWINGIGEHDKVKLEIASSIRPEPYKKMELKTYIHEFLEEQKLLDDIKKYELTPIEVNVLDITRTFVDKVLAVKRHAFNGNLDIKVRHIYDVVCLFEHEDIKALFVNKAELKELLDKTKKTDQFYIKKRKLHEKYIPDSPYNFDEWKEKFDSHKIRSNYESLHEELLYTNEIQQFDKAIKIFEEISSLFQEIEGN
ncbi:nucleotidyl transferase AbiEii/AbiGii toxin family protein [uncultured Abiotrophia sp.]|uniref:nucleotidyl transferase AbiEii/AbiGii toxin family protein n=1 Tax=uncultured Abiotrophia sp. TaxID=316094 RepID=UPI00261ABFB6|nr:nucleotidyl transferase AbiEii/AbiGii toxin family protein [uncultured Abiotrophia sp.]